MMSEQLDDRVAASHEALRAKLAEVERERDEAVSRSERVSSFAATLIGNACERHSAEIAVMGFHEFQQVQPKSCHWCCEADRDRLAAEVELRDRQIAYLNGQVARQADEIAKERHLRVRAEADRDRLAAENERLRAGRGPAPGPRGGVMVKAGDVYEVKPFPFVRHVATILGEDGPEDIECWKPGTRFEARQRYLGHGEYDETVDCIADGEGVLRMTVVGVYTPPGYPQRIFYRRQWIDPDGKVFGARKLMVCVTSAFYRRARGYMHDYMVNGSSREGSGSRCWPKPTPTRVTPAREEGQ